MKTVLILHGITGHAGIHWQKWLHDKLVKKGYKVFMPNLPDTNNPQRNEWLKTVKDLTSGLDFSDLVIIAHSLGVVTALDLIEESGKKLNTLISVAGFSKDYGAELNSYFLREKDIDLEKVKKLVNKVYIIQSDNDPYVPQEILKDLAYGLGVKPIVIKNGGHFNTGSGYTTFPLILEFLN